MFQEIFSSSSILLPVLVLVIWTLVMQSWMVLTRLPAMTAAKLDVQAAERTADLAAKLPRQVQWKADNYNHLLEQPTIFYAAALTLAIAGLGEGANLVLAWIYVASRVAHSIVHATINKVLVRFTLFGIGSLALLVMTVNGALKLVG